MIHHRPAFSLIEYASLAAKTSSRHFAATNCRQALDYLERLRQVHAEDVSVWDLSVSIHLAGCKRHFAAALELLEQDGDLSNYERGQVRGYAWGAGHLAIRFLDAVWSNASDSLDDERKELA